MTYQLYHGDCLEIMPTLPAGSVDCVFTDLPYFGIVDDEWDNQWKDRNEYLDWVVSLAREWKRITKANSSIFIFCDEKMEAYIQVRLDEIFLLLNKIVWFKRNNLPQKNAHLLRTFAPMTERALFYENKMADRVAMNASGYEQACNSLLVEIFQIQKLCKENNITRSQIAEVIKQDYKNIESAKAQASNWILGKNIPNPIDFERLKTIIPIKGEYEALRLEYEALRLEYEALRLEYEALRRPFNADTKTWDVIENPIIGGDENTDHPTTKPLSLSRRILSIITNPGQVVLDCCMGSGTFGQASVELMRDFIGIEKERKYFEIAEKRIQNAHPPLFVETTNQVEVSHQMEFGA